MNARMRSFAHSVPFAIPAWRALYQLRRKALINSRLFRKSVYSRIDRSRDEDNLRINIGGGQWYLRHWRVMDAPIGVRSYLPAFVDYEIDLASDESFPFRDQQAEFIYTSHTLEHIAQKFIPHILGEAQRSLKPGGAIRITTPDYDKAADAYEARDRRFFTVTCSRSGDRPYRYPMLADVPDDEFIDRAFLFYFAKPLYLTTPVEEIRSLYASLGRYGFADELMGRIDFSRHNATVGNVGDHVNWFTHEKLIGLLREAGFSDAYRSSRNESRFREMRHSKGFFDSSYTEISLYVEAVR